jgi:NDP-sugar pyrophosphorylase family protein
MIVIVPMAGRGSRFRDAGLLTPKPFLIVRGRKMYVRAIECLPLAEASRVLLVVRHEDQGAWMKELAKSSGTAHTAHVIGVPETRGQAESVAIALGSLGIPDLDQSVLIGNCDTAVDPKSARQLALDADQSDGRIHLFRADGDQWSFAALDDSGDVVRVAEKVRISEWCSTGLYWFRTGQLFLDLFEQAVQDLLRGKLTGELYVAPMLDRLIRAGGRVKPYYARAVEPMGTPEDLDQLDPQWRAAASLGDRVS